MEKVTRPKGIHVCETMVDRVRKVPSPEYTGSFVTDSYRVSRTCEEDRTKWELLGRLLEVHRVWYGSTAINRGEGRDSESHPIRGRDGMERERELIQLSNEKAL